MAFNQSMLINCGITAACKIEYAEGDERLTPTVVGALS